MSNQNQYKDIPTELLKKQLNYKAYVVFGKFILQYLKLVEDPNELNWFNIIRQFTRHNTEVKAGMMHINWTVCKAFNQSPIKIRYNRSRDRVLVLPRQVSIYLASSIFKLSRNEICDFYEFKNLTSINSATTRVENLLFGDKQLREKVDNIVDKLLNA